MSFTFAPAVRDRVGLIIGLAGASGSGKTLSGLKIARGLAGGDDGKIAFIDTERGRGKHYAPAPGEAPGPNAFAFRHGDLAPPFQPEAYLKAITTADEAGFEVILIDSFSHSWDGEGGLQDMHDAIVADVVGRRRRTAEEKNWRFDEAAEADKASLSAWKEPKLRHKRLVSRLLQCRAHLVICMRADERMRMETVEEKGRNDKIFKKTVIVAPKDMPLAERWVPIVEKRLPYELTLSFVLAPTAPGVPIPIKLQEQHRAAVPLDRPIDEEVGRRLAAWARGETIAPRKTETRQTSTPATESGKPSRTVSGLSAKGQQQLFDDAREQAQLGARTLAGWREGLEPNWNEALREIEPELVRLAEAADAFPGNDAIRGAA